MSSNSHIGDLTNTHRYQKSMLLAFRQANNVILLTRMEELSRESQVESEIGHVGSEFILRL